MTTFRSSGDAKASETVENRRALPSWRELHPGDDPLAEELQFEHWRTVPPAEKMRQLAALCELARRLALAGLSRRYPSADQAMRRRLLAELMLGKELADSIHKESGGQAGAL